MKRKRDLVPVEELEIDIDAPEPSSKRAQRLAKKGKIVPPKPRSPSPPPIKREGNAVKNDNQGDADLAETDGTDPPQPSSAPKKSLDPVYGIWIGNLNWTTDKAALRLFLTERGNIPETSIARIHMPTPSKSSASNLKRPKPAKNKGFAYVDFSTSEAQAQAIALSETLIDGRKLLIKDATSFEGRPAEHAFNAANGNDAELTMKSGNPPNKRVFIGNLHYDTDRDGLREHFEQCGEVELAFVATFEDSGKCKGYAWVTFADLEGAKNAVRGWVSSEKQDNGEEETRDGKPQRRRAKKEWINVFYDRRLRVEFAEDSTVRYQKRFGKGRNKEEVEVGE
jgi:RNA recognition motif-containing protein